MPVAVNVKDLEHLLHKEHVLGGHDFLELLKRQFLLIGSAVLSRGFKGMSFTIQNAIKCYDHSQEDVLQTLDLLGGEVVSVSRLGQDHKEINDFVNIELAILVFVCQLEQLLRNISTRDDLAEFFLLQKQITVHNKKIAIIWANHG